MTHTRSSDQTDGLNSLGSGKTTYTMEGPSASILETFPNQGSSDYLITLDQPEFTSNCPKTGQPDFATITLDYIPDQLCVETKSFKLYMVAYRNHRSFMETITNDMLNHFVSVLHPKYLRVTAKFTPRGGTYNTVRAAYVREDYKKEIVMLRALLKAD